MKAKIDDVEKTLAIASTRNPYCDQWNEYGLCRDGSIRPIKAHSLPKALHKGDIFRTNGRRYEIIEI